MRLFTNLLRTLIVLGLFLSSPLALLMAEAEDWPTWRYDAARTAASPAELPSELHLAWWRDLGANHVAWAEDPRLQFDASYEPIVVGGTLIVGSSRNDSVTAFDAATGEQRWVFYAGGPVRLAPVVWQDGIYFGADDGYLYCLSLADGSLPVSYTHLTLPTILLL